MKVLLFGATGTAGHGVLRACFEAMDVTEVRAIARKAPKITGPKLRVYLHSDFLNYEPVANAFENVDLCLFCLGISVTQVSDEPGYRRITHEFAAAAAAFLAQASPAASFYYVSGQGAHLNSRMMWARVKAEAERDLMQRFNAVCWRPAYIDGPLSDSTPRFQHLMQPLLRMARPLRDFYINAVDLGRAMLQAKREAMSPRIVYNREIRRLSTKRTQLSPEYR
jgi:uncharacterized protein YbjT (DUF2867 family)